MAPSPLALALLLAAAALLAPPRAALACSFGTITAAEAIQPAKPPTTVVPYTAVRQSRARARVARAPRPAASLPHAEA